MQFKACLNILDRITGLTGLIFILSILSILLILSKSLPPVGTDGEGVELDGSGAVGAGDFYAEGGDGDFGPGAAEGAGESHWLLFVPAQELHTCL